MPSARPQKLNKILILIDIPFPLVLGPPPGLSDFVLAYLGRAFRAHMGQLRIHLFDPGSLTPSPSNYSHPYCRPLDHRRSLDFLVAA